MTVALVCLVAGFAFAGSAGKSEIVKPVAKKAVTAKKEPVAIVKEPEMFFVFSPMTIAGQSLLLPNVKKISDKVVFAGFSANKVKAGEPAKIGDASKEKKSVETPAGPVLNMLPNAPRLSMRVISTGFGVDKRFLPMPVLKFSFK